MHAQLETIAHSHDASCSVLWRELPEIPFIWHHHPQFELTLTLNACGQRYVGNDMADFSDGDLVLLGPNLPHTWAASRRPDAGRPMLAVVLWFAGDSLAPLLALPELAAVPALLQRARAGLAFSAACSDRLRPLLLGLQTLAPAQRLPLLLQCLLLLADDQQARTLSQHAPPVVSGQHGQRLQRALALLHRDLLAPPPLSVLASEAALSLGAFQRSFKRHTGHSVLRYLAQLRIGHACQLLIHSDKPVAVIASEAGYRSAAHFNRQFLAIKGMTPRALRALYRQR